MIKPNSNREKGCRRAKVTKQREKKRRRTGSEKAVYRFATGLEGVGSNDVALDAVQPEAEDIVIRHHLVVDHRFQRHLCLPSALSLRFGGSRQWLSLSSPGVETSLSRASRFVYKMIDV
ncbi:hypothetical protein BHE74_00024838 [Ensete ventricosum]|nr:hypothetical protein BHE74_00024838 [Ensete ventricosum]